MYRWNGVSMQETCLPAFSISKISISGEGHAKVGVIRLKFKFEVWKYILSSFFKNKSIVIPIVTKCSYYFYKVVWDWKFEAVSGCVVICFEIVKRWGCILSQMGYEKGLKQSLQQLCNAFVLAGIKPLQLCWGSGDLSLTIFLWLTWLPKRSQENMWK